MKKLFLMLSVLIGINLFSAGYINGEYYAWFNNTLDHREDCLITDELCNAAFKSLEINIIGLRERDYSNYYQEIELDYTDFIAIRVDGEIYKLSNWPTEYGEKPVIYVQKDVLLTWLKNNKKEIKFTGKSSYNLNEKLYDEVIPIKIKFNVGRSSVMQIDSDIDAKDIRVRHF